MVRLAKIKVDAATLDQYNAALKLQMTTAVKLEPGVLTHYAVADKKDATQITILRSMPIPQLTRRTSSLRTLKSIRIR